MQFHRIHQVILIYAPPSESAPPKRHMDRFVRICSAHDLHITHTHTEHGTSDMRRNSDNNNKYDNVYGAIIMTKVIVGVQPVFI